MSQQESVKLCPNCGRPGHYVYNYYCEDCSADRMGVIFGNSKLNLVQQYNMGKRNNGHIIRKVESNG